MRTFALLLSVLIVGCSSKSEDLPNDYFVSVALEDLPLVQAAAEEWNRCDVVRIHVSSEGGDWVAHWDPSLLPDELGHTSSKNKTIQFAKRDNVSVVAHEMGHMIGITWHTQGGLMDEYNVDGSVTGNECALLRSLHPHHE